MEIEREAAADSLNGLFGPQEPLFQNGFHEGLENWSHQKPISFQGASIGQIKNPGVYIVSDGLANQTNQAYVGNAVTTHPWTMTGTQIMIFLVWLAYPILNNL